MIDPGIGHHKAEAMLDDQQARATAHDTFCLGQHYLNEARILVDLSGQRDRPWRGLYCRDIDIASLAFRDDLLRHDQHITVSRHKSVRRKRVGRNRAEIVTRLDQLYAGKWYEGHRTHNCTSAIPSPRRRGRGNWL